MMVGSECCLQYFNVSFRSQCSEENGHTLVGRSKQRCGVSECWGKVVVVWMSEERVSES